MTAMSPILFPIISLFGTAFLVFIVSYDYRIVQKEIAQLFAHTTEYSRGKLQLALRQALDLRNALIGFHLSSICFFLSVPAVSADFFGVNPVLLVTFLCLLGFGCMVYGIINLLERLGHESR